MIKDRSSVVITGGASGIGKALAFRFGKEGHDIIIGDVEESALGITISELRSAGILATGIVVDVSDVILSARSKTESSRFTPLHPLLKRRRRGRGNFRI